jgi:hypothetical protein
MIPNRIENERSGCAHPLASVGGCNRYAQPGADGHLGGR